MYILDYILKPPAWRPCGAAMGWALATHGPEFSIFYALVTQLLFSDLRSTVICVEVTITSVFACLVDSEAKKASCTLHHAHITVH